MNVTFGPISHNSSKLTCLTITQITSNSNRHSPKTLSCFHDFSGFSKVTLFLWKWTVPPREGGTDPGRYLSMLLIFLHNDPRVTYLPTLQYVSLRYYWLTITQVLHLRHGSNLLLALVVETVHAQPASQLATVGNILSDYSTYDAIYIRIRFTDITTEQQSSVDLLYDAKEVEHVTLGRVVEPSQQRLYTAHTIICNIFPYDTYSSTV